MSSCPFSMGYGRGGNVLPYCPALPAPSQPLLSCCTHSHQVLIYQHWNSRWQQGFCLPKHTHITPHTKNRYCLFVHSIWGRYDFFYYLFFRFGVQGSHPSEWIILMNKKYGFKYVALYLFEKNKEVLESTRFVPYQLYPCVWYVYETFLLW